MTDDIYLKHVQRSYIACGLYKVFRARMECGIYEPPGQCKDALVIGLGLHVHPILGPARKYKVISTRYVLFQSKLSVIYIENYRFIDLSHILRLDDVIISS